MELALGILIGVVATVVILQVKSVGSLRVDHSDPYDGPYLFLELSKDVGSVSQHKYVILKVNVKNFITQN